MNTKEIEVADCLLKTHDAGIDISVSRIRG